jgi:sulfur carrier protein
MKINVLINGESREFEHEITISKLLKELSLEGKVMAAAVNMEIVKQNDWESYRLKDSDKLELLDFVGGG